MRFLLIVCTLMILGGAGVGLVWGMAEKSSAAASTPVRVPGPATAAARPAPARDQISDNHFEQTLDVPAVAASNFIGRISRGNRPVSQTNEAGSLRMEISGADYEKAVVRLYQNGKVIQTSTLQIVSLDGGKRSRIIYDIEQDRDAMAALLRIVGENGGPKRTPAFVRLGMIGMVASAARDVEKSYKDLAGKPEKLARINRRSESAGYAQLLLYGATDNTLPRPKRKPQPRRA